MIILIDAKKALDPISLPIHDISSQQTMNIGEFPQLRKNKKGNYANQNSKLLKDAERKCKLLLMK